MGPPTTFWVHGMTGPLDDGEDRPGPASGAPTSAPPGSPNELCLLERIEGRRRLAEAILRGEGTIIVL